MPNSIWDDYGVILFHQQEGVAIIQEPLENLYLLVIDIYHSVLHVLSNMECLLKQLPPDAAGWTFRPSSTWNSSILFCKFFIPNWDAEKAKLKKQLLYWIAYDLCFIAMDTFQIQPITILLSIISTEYQWLLAIFIPIFKVANTWMIKKIIQRTPATNIQKLNFLATTQVVIYFANYLATRISSLDEIAVYGIFAVDLLLHVHGCYEIIKLNRKIEPEGANGTKHTLATEQKERIVNLVTSEFVEAFVPVAFGIGFATAFYGPNAELLKNVKNDYFGGKVLEDITEFYIPLVLMFAFDVLE